MELFGNRIREIFKVRVWKVWQVWKVWKVRVFQSTTVVSKLPLLAMHQPHPPSLPFPCLRGPPGGAVHPGPQGPEEKPANG